MKFRTCRFDQMADEIRLNDKKIVIYGAGVIGTVTVPEILLHYGLNNRIDCYIDGLLSSKQSTIYVDDVEYALKTPDYIKFAHNCYLLLAISRFSEVIEYINQLYTKEDMICYVIPVMCIDNWCTHESIGEAHLLNKSVIPKKIHYMWFGNNQRSLKLEKCIDSWRRYCPDYEIIEWNESNYDVKKHPYMAHAYENGAYGFVPDYARLDILYHEGGIYLDTDVELIKSLDDLLCQEAFGGVEKWQTLNMGGCSGAVQGNSMLKKFLDMRECVDYINSDGSFNRVTCGYYDTKVLLQNGYRMNGQTQNICGMNIYAYDYFHPYDYMSGKINTTKNTYSIHHFDGGWLDEESKKLNKATVATYESFCTRIHNN